jgi:hypothetical protein
MTKKDKTSIQESYDNFKKMVNVLELANKDEIFYLIQNFDLTGDELLNNALACMAEVKFK